MKIKITEKPRSLHVNPPLIEGRVYQELDSKQYWFSGRIFDGTSSCIILFSLENGKAWTSNGGYGVSGARFIDVTDSSIFTVEI